MSPPNYRPHLSRDRKSDGQLEHTTSSPVLDVVVVLRMRARVFGVLKVEQPYSKKPHFAKRTKDVQVFLRLCDCCACSLCFCSRHFEGPARALTHPEKNIGRDPRKENSCPQRGRHHRISSRRKPLKTKTGRSHSFEAFSFFFSKKSIPTSSTFSLFGLCRKKVLSPRHLQSETCGGYGYVKPMLNTVCLCSRKQTQYVAHEDVCCCSSYLASHSWQDDKCGTKECFCMSSLLYHPHLSTNRKHIGRLLFNVIVAR